MKQVSLVIYYLGRFSMTEGYSHLDDSASNLLTLRTILVL